MGNNSMHSINEGRKVDVYTKGVTLNSYTHESGRHPSRTLLATTFRLGWDGVDSYILHLYDS